MMTRNTDDPDTFPLYAQFKEQPPKRKPSGGDITQRVFKVTGTKENLLRNVTTNVRSVQYFVLVRKRKICFDTFTIK